MSLKREFKEEGEYKVEHGFKVEYEYKADRKSGLVSPTLDQIPLAPPSPPTYYAPPVSAEDIDNDKKKSPKDELFPYTHYRYSSLGLSLTDTLDDLINEQRIEPQLAMKVLANFDKVITEVLADRVKARLTFKGHLDTYRFCDEVWTFLIKDVTFKLENSQSFMTDKIKIVSCNSSRPGN